MYTASVKTLYKELNGPTTYTLLPSGSYRILGISIQQSATNSMSELLCGTNIITKNYGKDFPYNEVSYICNNSVSIQKTGQDSASFILSYIDNNENITNDQYIGAVELATQSASAIYDTIYISWTFYVLMLLVAGIFVGLYIFKK